MSVCGVNVSNGIGRPAFKIGEGVLGPLDEALATDEGDEVFEREPSEASRGGGEFAAEGYACGGVGRARDGNLSLTYRGRCAG